MSATDRPLDSLPALMVREDEAGFEHCNVNVRHTPTATAGTAASGGQSIMCWDRDVVAPPLDGTKYRGWVVANDRMSGASTTQLFLVYRALLGRLTFGGGPGTFSLGAAMPSRYHDGKGVAQQVIPDFSILKVQTALAGSTLPVISGTYKNEKGVGGRNFSVNPLPSNPAINSGFLLNPLLQGTDKAITEMTAMSTSGGTSGVLEVWGCKMLGYEVNYTSVGSSDVQVFAPRALRQPILEPGDLYNVLKFNSTASAGSWAQWDLVPIKL